MTPRIVWLASYPKSGNTWVRVFLSNLTQEGTSPADLNDLRLNASSSDRHMFDQVLGFDTGDLGREQCARLRPTVYRWMNGQLREAVYCKTHDACVQVAGGDWLMAPDATDRVVYILRNPLDVAVSFAHHSQTSLDVAIKNIGDPDAAIDRQKPTRQMSQVEQPLGTWSEHVQSWTQNELFNTCVIRYEDLSTEPEQTFAGIATFLGLPNAGTQFNSAIRNASFDVLRRQEGKSGFRERPQNAEKFFRGGKIGGWKAALSIRQIDEIVKNHLPVMREFGYADRDGTPQIL